MSTRLRPFLPRAPTPAKLTAALLTVLSYETAAAQTQPGVDVRTWTPSPDPRASLVLEPTTVPEPLVFNVGVWASYAQAPVVLRDAASGAIVERPLAHALAADVVAGLGVGARLALGVDVPVIAWQDGSTALPETVVTGGSARTSGVGDVVLLAKATIVDDEMRRAARGFGLAAVGTVTLPTADQASFWGDGAATVGLRALAEYAVPRVGAVRASLGYVLRTSEHTWPDASVGGVTFGDAIPWSVGVVLQPSAIARGLDPARAQLWEVAAHGSLPAGPVAPFGLGGRGATSLSPVLAAVDDRVAFGHLSEWYVLVGADVGLDDAVGVPTFRAVLSLGWAARSSDRDHDGIVDEADECPDLPEDHDGIEDADGCPEDDADGDGIVDTEDVCPTVPGALTNRGCPSVRERRSLPTSAPLP